jgi:hypothetical protein
MTRAPTASQEIVTWPELKLVDVRIRGCFPPDAAHEATWATRRAIQSLNAGPGQHITLYDMTDAAPSPRETVELIRMGFANPVYKPLWARKVAFCARSLLVRRQIERLREVRPDIGVFDTREAALAFLTTV